MVSTQSAVQMSPGARYSAELTALACEHCHRLPGAAALPKLLVMLDVVDEFGAGLVTLGWTLGERFHDHVIDPGRHTGNNL